MFALLVEPPTLSPIVNRDHKTDRNDLTGVHTVSCKGRN